MKLLGAIVLALSCVGFSSAGEKLKCTAIPASIPEDWVDMTGGCRQKMKDQVKVEIDASLTYLAMGAYFARDKVNRPGFSKLFIEAANEEREHAIKVIEYLLMRGELTQDVGELLSFPLHPLDQVWENGAKALSDALKLETHVTRKIRDIIKTCEDTDGKNDYHLVDYLTADFLDEQYKGQRDLAGKLSTLGKMMEENIALGDFLFDKKLLKGEPL